MMTARWSLAGPNADRAFRLATAKLRALPDFIIIGAQKGGTAALHEYLSAHPRIGSPSRREIHYFDWHFDRSIDWYRSFFPLKRPGMQTGESTPDLLYWPSAPERLKRVLPSARFIVLLREPAARAFSHYRMSRRRGLETLSFRDALDAEAERLEVGRERFEQGVGRVTNQEDFSYAARGRYAEQLSRWFGYFGRERFLVLRSEELFASPGDALAAVQDWLGLSVDVPAHLTPRNVDPRPEPLDVHAAKRVREAVADDTVELRKMLGWDSMWEG